MSTACKLLRVGSPLSVCMHCLNPIRQFETIPAPEIEISPHHDQLSSTTQTVPGKDGADFCQGSIRVARMLGLGRQKASISQLTPHNTDTTTQEQVACSFWVDEDPMRNS